MSIQLAGKRIRDLHLTLGLFGLQLLPHALPIDLEQEVDNRLSQVGEVKIFESKTKSF